MRGMGNKKKNKKKAAEEEATADEKEAAATAIQKHVRGRQERKNGKHKKKKDKKKGGQAKGEAAEEKGAGGEKKGQGKKKKAKKAEDMSKEEAATKIQAAQRAKQAKKEAAIKRKKKAARLKKEKQAKKKELKKAHEEAIADVSLLFEKGKGAYVRNDQNRGCTDCIFCVAFAVYWWGMIFLAYYAITEGDMNKLIQPRDMDGNSCGLENELNGAPDVDLTEYKTLYLPNPADPEAYQICVTSCPGDGSKGTCTGNVTFNYLGTAATTAGSALGSSAATVVTSAVSCDQCPQQYTREATCVAKGDCSDGGVDVTAEECATRGDCSNGWTDIESKDCLYNQSGIEGLPAPLGYLSDTGLSFSPYVWTAYHWEYEKVGLIMCQPPQMPSSPRDADYQNNFPPSFAVASRKGWIGSAGPCWMPVLQTTDIVFRCVPTMLADFSSPDAMKGSMAGSMAAQYFQDVFDYWFIIPAGAVFALIAAFAWIVFLSKFAGLLIWTTVYTVETLLPVLGLVALYKAGAIESPVDVPPEIEAEMTSVETSQQLAYNIAIACFSAWAVLGIVFCIYKARIEISIGVIEEASDAFLDVPLCIFFPLGTLILSLPVSCYCLIACFLLLSLRDFDQDTGAAIYSDELKGMLAYQVFGWLWTCWFLTSVQFTAVSGAVARWYFTPEDKDGHKTVSFFLLSGSLYRVLKHHLGTMAFGSFIVAAVMTFKFIAVYMITQVQAQSPENKVVKFLGNILKAVVGCLERFIRFLGHLAYIETAIYGTAFCRSLLKAFVRLVKNVIRFAFVTLFSKLVLFLGKIGVIIASVWWCILWMQFTPDRPNNVSASIPIAPLVLAGVAGTVISFAIMGVYETAIDTIMVCFLEDEAENDDKGQITFASGELKQFMKGTKSIADAEEAYVKTVRDAKTSKIRANSEAEKEVSKIIYDRERAAAQLSFSRTHVPSDAKLSVLALRCLEVRRKRRRK